MFVGLFDRFNNLDQIKTEEVLKWLNPVPQLTWLENYIANRILYPQAIPILPGDIKTDLAILREALRLNEPSITRDKTEFLGGNPFINITMRKIMIPVSFLEFIPDLSSLVWVFIDGLLLNRSKKDWFQDFWTVILSNTAEEIIGTVLLPQFQNISGVAVIKIEGKIYKIKAGNMNTIPCLKEHCPVDFSINGGKILGKNKSTIEIYGGKVGLIVDARVS